MTIEEAIDYIRQEATTCACEGKPNTNAALKLGIEALKHCRDIHHMSYEDLHILLPGETPEQK